VTELEDMKVASLCCLLAQELCGAEIWAWHTEKTGLHTAKITYRDDWTAHSESNI
jgi:hypothetical protein